MVAIKEDLLKEYALCSSILVMKILAMAILTGRQRFRKKVFANPEDANGKSQKVVLDDPDVERVRRAHRNDLENILPWFVMTLIWLTTNPSYYLAMMLMRIFVAARITHTLVYVVFPMQPHRALAFFAGYLIIIYEAVSTIIYYI
ncbi:microsomal glutathione S-transferase 1-like [Chelonus insularis]|uniref:microsomal glutathione S-transferase 1-like n=1 Tax=Chelonus insularis TaxID=460826 RepID=UPI00158D6560|nr:microsomal glutathione S-transferase 1-like [Chelonus insularis]